MTTAKQRKLLYCARCGLKFYNAPRVEVIKDLLNPSNNVFVHFDCEKKKGPEKTCVS